LRILITGAGGLLGHGLAAELARDHEVWGIVRAKRSRALGFQPIELDLSAPLTRDCLPKSLDAVFHLAQSSGYRDFPDKAQDMFDVNVRSTLTLLEYARSAGVRTFVFASSGGVYGRRRRLLREDEPVTVTDELDFHLKLKCFGEQIVASYRGFFDTSILRVFFMYGPGQRKGMLVPRLFESVRRHEPVTVVGNDGPFITPTFVSDVVEAAVRMLTVPGHHLVNIARNEPLSIRAVAEIIAEAQGVPLTMKSITGDSVDLIPDTRKMEHLLSFRCEVPFREGIRRIIAASADGEALWRD
jgi:UDP-glucose 4-epimerase